MLDKLNSKQLELYNEFIDFTNLNIEPYANEWDIKERISEDIIKLCKEKGYLGATISNEFGGKGWSCIEYGLLNEAIGRSSVSLTGMFNVHTMVAQTLMRWGTDDQKNKWLPKMATGEILGAFALTEPAAGSDIKGIETKYELKNDKLIINGTKRWITFGAIADILIVFGKLDGKPIACIVEKGTPGLTVKPVENMLGFRAAHLAVLEFKDCEIDRCNVIAKENFALSHIAPYALDFGRLSVAWTALGILRGCVERCGEHTLKRKTFKNLLVEHGQISEMITNMGVDLEAASHLCFNASKLRDENSYNSNQKIMIAKYFTSRAAAKHSSNAVQIMGALGCNDNFAVSRYYRDSKTLEIIEGSNEIHQIILGKSFARSKQKNILIKGR